MASTEQLPSGRFRGVYRDANSDKQHVPGTFRLKTEAQNAANDAESIARRQAALKTGTLAATITWDEWWVILSADREFESDTGATEHSIVTAQLSPKWGSTPLNRIDNLAIQDWIDTFAKRRSAQAKRYSASYVRRVYAVFTMTIHTALRKKVLTASPLTGIVLPKVPKRAKPYVSVEQGNTLARQMRHRPKRRAPQDDHADALEFGLETGVRPGELAGLHDDQVDVEQRQLTVRTVYVPRSKKMRNHPKDGDERMIPLTAKALEIYRRRTEGRDMRRPCGVEHFDGPCTGDLVFRTSRGRVLNIANLSAAMKTAAVEVGIPAKSPYALRRGFATRLRDAGADPFTIMELMGHETVEETHGYAQQGPDFDRKVRAALADPEAAGLRVVGQDSERGTERGTDAGPDAPGSARITKRRKSG